MTRARIRVAIVGLVLAVFAFWVWTRFQSDIAVATARAAQGSIVVQTRCGPIEYQEAGSGIPLLAVHGSGGGHDQGMAFARPLTKQGIRVIAMSRFGYLRTPMPADASAAAQADAHICLLDALGIGQAAVLGGSAGAPSAIQMAIRHPDRTSALILLVPLTYMPPNQAASAPAMPSWAENMMMSVIGSDFLLWSALHLFRSQLINTVIATPPALLETASLPEQARVNAMLDNILPSSSRAAGIISDTAGSKTLGPSRLDLVTATALIISARDDKYGTYATAQYTAAGIKNARFMGFETGGHVWVGHNDEVMDAIADLIVRTPKRVTP